ncbi:MAG: hypothetical protein Q8933_07220 [Bacteroidota bacterium]|nr:hypothetical protein [Bacteroidota bacterium]MDP4193519.1 hypothetical protein [Bacteroidota bacterium]
MSALIKQYINSIIRFRNPQGMIKNIVKKNKVKENIISPVSVFNYIKLVFPEAFLDEIAGCIGFQRKTDTNLTIFTVTINKDKLSFSYNNCGLLDRSSHSFMPDEGIINEIRGVFLLLNSILLFEFYEEHDNITWKHEIYQNV